MSSSGKMVISMPPIITKSHSNESI